MKNNITLFITIIKRDWLEMIRYSFNMVSGIVTLYLLFLFIFLGYRAVGAQTANFGNNLDSIVVGFMLWNFSTFACSSLTWNLFEEARIGTLEQLYMTSLGFDKLCMFRIVGDFFLNFIFIVPVLVLMMATTGRWLHIDILSLTPLFIFTLASAYGIGFICGGLGLVFKQIQSFFQIVQFVLLGFIAAPVNKIPVLKILPLSLGTNLIKEVMVNKLSITELPIIDLILLALNGIFYFGIGFIVFKICEAIAKKRGLLGHY
ncbi:MAG: ABC transporter permease [Candidatus Stahlbacteria bacterium]|nr:ABC transporter permease [Candidatus Stahlbacteria bacterium]